MDILCITIHQKCFTVVPTPNSLRVWGSGSLVESNWCDYVKVEANSHLKLLPPSTLTLEIYKVFEHIYRLSISIQQQPYTVLHILLVSDFRVLSHLWGQNDVITSRLRLTTATSNCFPHPLDIYEVFEHFDMLDVSVAYKSTGVFAVVAQASSLLLSWHRALASSQMCLILIWKTSWMDL